MNHYAAAIAQGVQNHPLCMSAGLSAGLSAGPFSNHLASNGGSGSSSGSDSGAATICSTTIAAAPSDRSRNIRRLRSVAHCSNKRAGFDLCKTC
jgi:hypothetical protein